MKSGNASNRILIFAAVLTAVFMLLSFSYEDLRTRTIWKLNFLDVAFEGRIDEYYSYSELNIHDLQYPSGNFVKGLAWSVWNIPVWIVTYFFKMDICEHPFLYMWSYLYLVFVLLCSYKIFVKSAELLGTEKKDIALGGALFVFSPFVYIGILYSGQNDVEVLFLYLLSMYGLFKDRKGVFWLGAVLCYWMKPFYLFSYIAVILLCNKNIFKIIGKTAGLLSFSFLVSLILKMMHLQPSSSQNESINNMWGYMLQGFPGINGIQISILIFVLVLIYFAAYMTKAEGEQRNRVLLYYAALPTLAYFCLVDFEHYRVLLLVPVIVMIIIANKDYLKINIMLLTILNGCGLLAIIGNSHYLLNMRYIKGTVFEMILKNFKTLNYDSGIRSNMFTLIPHYEVAAGIAAAFFVAAAGVFAFVNYPERKELTIAQSRAYSRVLVGCNVCMIIPVLALAFMRL